MPILRISDELPRYDIRSWRFWRNLAVYFCVFSLVGHWLEFVYCLFNDFFFGIVDEDSLVWQDLWYPFLVYGFGVTACTLLFIPLKQFVSRNCRTVKAGLFQFYVISVFLSMCMELAQGFIQNRPDENGVYPLWDNSELPFNILGQAWLVNDILLGARVTLYVWLLYPLLEKAVLGIGDQRMNVLSVIVIVGFIILCIVKFSA